MKDAIRVMMRVELLMEVFELDAARLVAMRKVGFWIIGLLDYLFVWILKNFPPKCIESAISPDQRPHDGHGAVNGASRGSNTIIYCASWCRETYSPWRIPDYQVEATLQQRF